MAGWIVRQPALVQVLPGVTAMVFNTALMFVLAGLALIAFDSPRLKLAVALAAAVILVAAVTQAQNLAGVDFGVDWPSLHAWLDDGNRHPGRQAVPTSAVFALFGAAVILVVRGGPAPAWLPSTLAWLVVAIGAANLAAYLFRLDELLGALRFPRMGVLTSAGALVLGLAFIGSRRMRMLRQREDAARERITLTAALLLASIASVTGMATLAVMEGRMRAALGETLLGRLNSRAELLGYIVNDAERNARSVANRPGLLRGMHAVNAGNSVDENLEFMRSVTQSFLEVGFSAVTLRDPGGRILAQAGFPAQSAALEVVVRTPLASGLLWNGRMLLRTELEMRDAAGVAGSVSVEQPLPDFTLVSAKSSHLGKTGEIAICARGGTRLRCFPTRHNPRAFESALDGATGVPLPMTLATDGQSGAARTVDYRGQAVIAAYAPVGALGLGMVFKMDTDEIYAPIRSRVLLGFAILVVLVSAGTLLLRSRIRPLVERLVRAEDDARESTERLRGIADNVPALVAYLDGENRFRFANATYAKWFGLAGEQLIGRTMREIWGEELYLTIGPRVERARAGETVVFDRTIPGDGGERHLRGTYIPHRDAGGRVVGMYVHASDVTQNVEAQRKLDHAKERLQLALEASGAALWDADIRTGEVVLSERWAEMIGEAPHETRTNLEELMAMMHPQDVKLASGNLQRALSGAIPEYAEEHRVRARDGRWFWILSRGKVVERDRASGRALRMVGTNTDVTARKLAEQRMEQLAHYDVLTGAANRALFSDRVNQALVRARRGNAGVALLCLDIDRFKSVNDRFGHAAGDALLKAFAARLRACVRETDTVGRLGGDEFTVLLEGLRDDEGASRVAEKIIEAMRAPVHFAGTEILVSTSIGIAILRDGKVEDADTLAKRADAALYEAKAAGRNTFRASSAPA